MSNFSKTQIVEKYFKLLIQTVHPADFLKMNYETYSAVHDQLKSVRIKGNLGCASRMLTVRKLL